MGIATSIYMLAQIRKRIFCTLAIPDQKKGVYYKDVRKPPSHIKASSINGFETIEFNVPVDLNKLKIAVALFSGFSHAGIEGEVRLMVDGETYGRSFEISASSGGKTSGIEDSFREGSATEPHIVMIDPLDIVSPKSQDRSGTIVFCLSKYWRTV